MTDLQAEKARRSLAEFVRLAWEVIEPGTPLLWNWHIDAICEHLEAVTRGEIKRLVINIPPGHMKSILVSVMWPAWEWVNHPKIRSLFSSYAFELATRDSVRCRDIVQSEWYQDAFAPHWRLHDMEWDLSDDQNAKHWFTNSAHGFRFCLSVGGRATGFRGNKIVTDDPLNAIDRHSVLKREKVIDWWDRAMSSRLNDPRNGAKVVIAQRLHQGDLPGHLKSKGYEYLVLPSEFVPAKRSKTSIGWQDPRTEPGELLHPELFTKEVLAQALVDLQPLEYAGQHQQEPAPAEGTIIKAKWWRYYTEATKPTHFDELIASWDMAFKDTKTSAYVVGHIWGRSGANAYLVDSVRAKMDFDATLSAFVDFCNRWPQAYAKLVEDKANGPAIISSLRNKISGIIAVQPDGSKEARAYALQPFLQAGNFYLPALAVYNDGTPPTLEDWVQDFIDECTMFPNGDYADQVDTWSQAGKRLFLDQDRTENIPNPFA